MPSNEGTPSRVGVIAFLVVLLLAVCGTPCTNANTLTYTGAFSDPNQVLQIIFTVQTPTDVSIQTNIWAAGGFDPVLWLFDSLGNQITKDDDICNGVDCTPAIRDSLIQVTALAPGTYTAILSAWDQHFWRAISAGNPPGVDVTGWSYGGTFGNSNGNYTLTFTSSTNLTPITQVIFPPSDIGPDAPVLTAPAGGATGVSLTPTLNWTTVTGTNGYSVYWGTAYVLSSPAVVSGPPFTVSTPLSPNTTYYWKVASRDPTKNNTENPSLVSTFTTTTASTPPPPPAPTQISPGNGTTGLSLTPSLIWSASTGSNGYDVYLGTTNPPPSVGVTNSLSFSPSTPLTAGLTYFWKVASRDPNNNNAETASSVWSFSTAQPLAAPTLLSPANGATGVATNTSLAWSPVSGSSGYMVYLGTTNPPTSSTFATASPFTPATTLAPGTPYFWRVSSRDPNNNNAESLSPVSSFTTASSLAAPTLSSPSNLATVSSTTPTLSWNAVTGSAGYTVYLGTTNPPTNATQVSGTSFIPSTPLTQGVTYFWMVASRDPNNSNKEADSPVWSFTIAASLAAPTLVSPPNTATNVSTTPTLSWNAVTGTAGYSLYFGTTNPPTTSTQVTGTTFTPSSALALNTIYYWMVASRDPNNNNKEAPSAVWSFTTTAGLAAPTLVSPANAATNVSTTPTLSWSAVTGTAGYSLYFGTTNPPTTPTLINGTSFSPSSALSLNKTYYWSVASRDPNNNNKESASAVWSFATTAGLAAPTLVSPANAATNASTTPTLTWSAVTGTAGYSLYFGTTNPPTTAASITGTSFTPSPALSQNTTYFWMVASRDPNNNNHESPSVVWSFTTRPALAAPMLAAPTNNATQVSLTPTLTWSAVTGTSGYSVYFGTTNPPVTSTQVTGTSYSPSTLTLGTTYYWMVASRDPNNSNKESTSAVWSFTTKTGLPAPTLLSPANGSAAAPLTTSLSWSPVAGTSGYTVYFGTTNPPAKVVQTTSTTYTPTSLALGTTYYWMISSRDPNNNNQESPSAVWSFSTVPPDAAPTLISPPNGATNVSTGATLSWNTVLGSAGYNVYLGTTNPPPFVLQTSSAIYAPGPMTQGKTYYWMIASRDPNNNNQEKRSPIWSFTVGSALPAPTQISPSNGATGVGLTPTLTWNAVTGTVGYSVYFGTTNPPTGWTQVFNPTFTPASPLVQGVTYYWMVASRDPSNNNKEADSSVWSFVAGSGSPSMPAPTQLAPANGSTGSSTLPTLSWNAVSGSAGYLVYLGTTNPPASSVQTSGTSYTPPSALSAGVTYYWKVSSLDPAHGNKEAQSAVWSFTTAAGSSSPYGYRRVITVDHTKVPNTDQTSFPLLFSTTDPALKSTTSGGHVNSSSGFDVIFTSDSGGTQRLDHEIESYNPSTGQLTAWVRLPNLSPSTDTVIYMLYGNPAISSSQENRAGVWSNGFNAVYHLADNAANTAMTDSTGKTPATLRSNSNSKSIPGPIASALTFNGSSDFATASDGPNMRVANVRTVSMWVNVADLSGSTTMRLLCEFQDANNHWSLVAETPTSQNGSDVNTIEADIVSGGVESKQKLPNNSIAAGSWYHLAVSFNGSSPTAIYLNGKNLMVPSLGQDYGYGSTPQMTFGARNDDGRLFGGSMDEIRISNATRSADWIAAEYNNQSKPSTFYGLGSEIAQH